MPRFANVTVPAIWDAFEGRTRLPFPDIREENHQVSGSLISVRQATLADAEDIGEAHASAWEVAYVDLFEPEVLRHAVAIRRTMWGQILARSDFDFNCLLVAEQDKHVVGYSQYGQSGEKNSRGEIFGFYLHPAKWGQGAATRLMTASLARLGSMGLDPVVVWTHPGALRAQGFYVKCGFRTTQRSRVAILGSGLEAPEVEFERDGNSESSARAVS